MPLRSIFELILLAALWGASYLFLRIASPEFGPIALIAIRVAIASAFLLPIWYLREAKRSRAMVQSHWWPLTIVGLINSAAPFVLFSYATLHVTGGFAAILNATAPIWGALVAWVWLGLRPNINSGIGLSLGIIGVVVLVQPSLRAGFNSASLGALAATFAAFLYGIAANYTSQKLSSLTPLSIATFSQVAATIVLAPLAVVYFPSGQVSLLSWLSVVALGILCTGVAYTLYFRLIASVGSTRAITVTFLIPVFAALWGALFIDEQITLVMLIGSLIIFSGTALVNGVLKIAKPTTASSSAH